MNAEIVFVSKKGRNITWNKLCDLSAYKIGVALGNSYSDEFDKATCLNKKPGKLVMNNVSKLLKDRIDLVVDAKLTIFDSLKQLKRDKSEIQLVGKPLKSQPMHIIFSRATKDGKQLNDDFNEGLKQLKK